MGWFGVCVDLRKVDIKTQNTFQVQPRVLYVHGKFVSFVLRKRRHVVFPCSARVKYCRPPIELCARHYDCVCCIYFYQWLGHGYASAVSALSPYPRIEHVAQEALATDHDSRMCHNISIIGARTNRGPERKPRYTVCVSSQVGCAMNCQFCYTGRLGLLAHLQTAQVMLTLEKLGA